jgi:hypothetical protein
MTNPKADFVGRDEEMSVLRRMADSPIPMIAVVYGRRRIGKSMLLRTAFTGRPTLLFEGLENQPKRVQIANFLEQLCLQTQTSRAKCDGVHSWREAFRLLHSSIGPSPVVICFDEFQWMANYRREIVSDLALIWNQHLSTTPGLKLVLCGSIASFMIRKVVKGTALYGRVDEQIHLRAFELGETRALLRSRGIDEILDAHLFTGGVPKYLSLLDGQPSIRTGLERLAFAPGGYLFREYDRIFTSHFGNNPVFEGLIAALATHPEGMDRTGLAQATATSAGGMLSQHLSDLEAAGFVSSCQPLDKDENTRLTRYVLTDAYLRFYFAFIRPNRKQIVERTAQGLFARLQQSGAFNAWMGKAFERLCLQHAARISELLGFAGIDFRHGPFFRRASSQVPGTQIDLLFDRKDKVMTLCEMKYTASGVGVDVIPEVEKKVEVLSRIFPRRTIQRVLITNLPASPQLLTRGYFYRVILAEELCREAPVETISAEVEINLEE